MNRGGGTLDYSVRPASGRLDHRIPATTDQCRKTCIACSTAKRSVIGVISRFSKDDHYKRKPRFTVRVACLRTLLLNAISTVHKSKFVDLPPVIMTSPCKWNILEWNENRKQTKHTQLDAFDALVCFRSTLWF